MAKRTIYFQDKLNSRYENIKGHIELSRTCARALEEEVNKVEERMGIATGVGRGIPKSVVDRLKREKKRLTAVDFNKGAKRGFAQAQHLRFEDIQRGLKLAYDVEGGSGVSGHTLEFLKECNIQMSSPGKTQEDFEVTNLDAFYGGIFQGIKDFWEQVEEHLN